MKKMKIKQAIMKNKQSFSTPEQWSFLLTKANKTNIKAQCDGFDYL